MAELTTKAECVDDACTCDAHPDAALSSDHPGFGSFPPVPTEAGVILGDSINVRTAILQRHEVKTR